MYECFENTDIILGSQSPRRKQLLQDIGIKFRSVAYSVEEIFPKHLKAIETALYLSELKAKAFSEEELKENSILITADTVVSLADSLLGKPKDVREASEMLQRLSGKCHEVITAFTFRSKEKMKSFYAETKVYFKVLSEEEINYYITEYQPFDKAGAYGIQEWIGKIGIEKIKGSYFNVMGLPVHQVYSELCTFDLDRILD
ncbi:MAG: septum formation protein Maf [Bacteroidales bacterium]|nr:septum formation protein Maf [Bacteroidales bacterium]